MTGPLAVRAWRVARRPRDARRSKGQSIVEFAVAVPIFMMLMLGMLEFGFVFTHQLGLEYATREGARMGSALGAGTDQIVCADVDKNIIAALQRVLTSPGTQLAVGNITSITIYDSNTSGQQVGAFANTWTPGAGPTVDGTALQFQPPAVDAWPACGRKNSWTIVAGVNVPPDSIGVHLDYRYQFVTPLGNFVRAFSSGTLLIGDQTVMAINPT